MMKNRLCPALAATTILALATAPASAQPTLEDIIIAMPNFTFTSTPNFIAEELGLWAKYGLRVKIIQIAGVGATNAVIAPPRDRQHRRAQRRRHHDAEGGR